MNTNEPLRLSDQSKVRLTNNFSARSVFPNIDSYRVCMSFLAVVPLDYKILEGESDESVIKFFRKKLSNDENALRYFIDFKDFTSVWSMTNNQRKMKQSLKANLLNQMIMTYIRLDDKSLRSIFEEVSDAGDMLCVHLSPRAMPLLINAHLCDGGFTRPLPVELLKPFRSVYTAKLFERLVRFHDTGKLVMSIETIQDVTGCKSADFSTIRRDVIKKAEAELLKYELLQEPFVIKAHKSGRKVTKVEIFFKLTEKVTPPAKEFIEFVGNDEDFYEPEQRQA